MSATKEQLTERLTALKTQKDAVLSQANAIMGAIQSLEAIIKDHYTDESRIILPDPNAPLKFPREV